MHETLQTLATAIANNAGDVQHQQQAFSEAIRAMITVTERSANTSALESALVAFQESAMTNNNANNNIMQQFMANLLESMTNHQKERATLEEARRELYLANERRNRDAQAAQALAIDERHTATFLLLQKNEQENQQKFALMNMKWQEEMVYCLKEIAQSQQQQVQSQQQQLQTQQQQLQAHQQQLLAIASRPEPINVQHNYYNNNQQNLCTSLSTTLMDNRQVALLAPTEERAQLPVQLQDRSSITAAAIASSSSSSTTSAPRQLARRILGPRALQPPTTTDTTQDQLQLEGAEPKKPRSEQKRDRSD
jgi:molybdopterin converting factor small subunit